MFHGHRHWELYRDKFWNMRIGCLCRKYSMKYDPIDYLLDEAKQGTSGEVLRAIERVERMYHAGVLNRESGQDDNN